MFIIVSLRKFIMFKTSIFVISGGSRIFHFLLVDRFASSYSANVAVKATSLWCLCWLNVNSTVEDNGIQFLTMSQSQSLNLNSTGNITRAFLDPPMVIYYFCTTSSTSPCLNNKIYWLYNIYNWIICLHD